MDRLQTKIHALHLSCRTETAYMDWIYRYIIFHKNRSPEEMGEQEIAAFLSFLANDCHVSAASQHQALQAITFLYKQVFEKPIEKINFVSTQRNGQIPGVLSRNEVQEVLKHLEGETWLMAALLYGCGLQVHECLALRIKDLDFENSEIIVENSNQEKFRRIRLPEKIIERLRKQVDLIRSPFYTVCTDGSAESMIPQSLADQYLFPGDKPLRKLGGEPSGRKHRSVSFLQKALKQAGERVGISKHVCCSMLRHSFAVHLFEEGYDIRIIQKLLGHSDVRTTMIYTHLAQQKITGVKSPLDNLILSGVSEFEQARNFDSVWV